MNLEPLRNIYYKEIVGVSVASASIGYLGAFCVSLISPSVLPAGFAILCGLTPGLSMGVFLLAHKINVNCLITNAFFAVFVGYLSAYAVTGGMGFTVSFIAPLVSAAAILITSVFFSAILTTALAK